MDLGLAYKAGSRAQVLDWKWLTLIAAMFPLSSGDYASAWIEQRFEPLLLLVSRRVCVCTCECDCACVCACIHVPNSA